MLFSDYLNEEWLPALGCTEPASIAYATALAAARSDGEITEISLIVDPKMYKNCYAVGIPHSGHRSGILWAAAIGAAIRDGALGLECFKGADEATIATAGKYIDSKIISVDVDTAHTSLFIDCRIGTAQGSSRAVIAGDHTNLVRLEKDGIPEIAKELTSASSKSAMREKIANLSIGEIISLASTMTDDDHRRLTDGAQLNLKIAEHGLNLFPEKFLALAGTDSLARISTLVCGGVYARMWGEDFTVMSLSGSGNKGIVCSVPIIMHAHELKLSDQQIAEALAIACLITTATTHHLGTLSAVCGCSNAAGIGLAAALVHLEGGSVDDIERAINNMVGNVTGMICDGAKIGCALKTMTAVDSAFRAAALALGGIGIPATDGIVGTSGRGSLKNLGRIANQGMTSADDEILAIMKEKLGKL